LGFSEEDFYGAIGISGGGGSSTAIKQESAPVAEPVKEKEAFDIKIGAVDAKAKIKIIKEVRAITGLGLKEV
jgi:large subunit ribosomal protein L7/L12